MVRSKGNKKKKAHRSGKLRSVFIGTTSLYALSISAPATAQDANDNCSLPDLSGFGGSLTIPTPITRILSDATFNLPSAYFVNCTSQNISFEFDAFGEILAVNSTDGTINTQYGDGELYDAPGKPSIAANTLYSHSASIINLGTIRSTGIAMSGRTISGNLVGYNSGFLSTDIEVLIGTSLHDPNSYTASAPLAPGMVLTSGASKGDGILSDQNTSKYFVGGNVSSGVNAGNISAINKGTINTAGMSSPGMVAISAGGQGGMGAPDQANNKYVAVAVGGSGGSGGNGGSITAENHSAITTQGLNSTGVKALSVGGGGGSGGTATAQSTSTNIVGASFSLAIGGDGGVAGNGEAVTVDLKEGSAIQTGAATDNTDYSSPQTPLTTTGGYVKGDHSPGVLAQSIGGGGGSGGHAVSLATAGGLVSVAVSVSKGGRGGAGGNGEAVTVTSDDAGTSIITGGRVAGGIVAQSIGGGGGSGGTVSSQSDSSGLISANVSVAMGAAGGAGGSSGSAQALQNAGSVTTYGMHSTGILAQSIAGGGGNGGNVVDGAGANGAITVSAHVNMGGDAGNGGTTGNAAANVGGQANVTTYGDHATGVLAQSIGGGGGNGGSIHSYSHTTGGGSVADGLTEGDASSLTFNANVNLGGTGGAGADAGSVSSGIVGTVATYGVASTGVLIQSIGGGGGNGGNIHAYSESITVDSESLASGKVNNSAFTATVDLGGSGGSAGNSGSALLALWGGTINTNQIASPGIVAQSIGGGGGNGGYTSSLDVTTSIPTNPSDFATRYASFVPGSDAKVRGNLDVSVNLGGSSGGGGSSGQVEILLDGGQVSTRERQSHGAIAQSVGGSGGMGGHAVANGFVGIGTYSFSAALGGQGGEGGNGGPVQLHRDQASAGLSNFTTSGDQSYGIFAQSIGGGGGSGGAAHIDLEKAPAGLSNVALGLTLGGSGGAGGSGSSVKVSDATITTSGVQSFGVFAQSVGGGGGNATLSDGSGAITLNLGGSGGTSGSGNALTLQNLRATTSGALAAGLVAQSIGGGGGLAGVASTGSLLDEAAQATVTSTFSLNTAGASGDGGSIFVGCEQGRSDSDCVTTISTGGTTAAGMVLQSIGGGGSASFLNTAGKAHSATVDFKISALSNSGLISVTDENGGTFNIKTSGDGAIGMLAQSFAGSGGAVFTTGALSDVTVNTGISMSSGKSGGLNFNLDASTITTSGNYAPGAFLQSGNAIYTVFASDGQQTHRQVEADGSLAVSDLQVVNRFFLNRDSTISTTGTQSHGIVMETYSYYGSTGAPASDVNDRSLNMWLDGDVTVSGTGSWGVMAGNTWDVSSTFPIPQPDNQTTAFTLGESATITANSGTAGGVKLWDTGNLLANINGIINAGTGTAIDISAGNSFLTVGSINDDFNSGIFQSYYGDIKVAANAAGGTHTITLNPGTRLYGTLKTDTSIGANNNITISGSILNSGADAINLGAMGGNTSVQFNEVRGNITASAGPSMQYSSLTNQGLMIGSINGPFVYKMTAGSAHILNIDAANNTSDIISVLAFERDTATAPNGNVAYINLNLASLPTPAFNSVTLVDITNGDHQVDTGSYKQEKLGGNNPNGGWGGNPANLLPAFTTSVPVTTDVANYQLSDFDIDNGNNVIQYDYVTSLQGTNFTVVVNDITIKLDQPALTGQIAQMASLAQSHVDAIKNGSIAPDPDSSIYKTLLNAANSSEGTDGKYANLVAALSPLGGTSLDPDIQSTTNAQRNATDTMHSCGGMQGAAVNPVEQGECVWSSLTYTNVELGNVAHDETSTNVAVGLQNAVGTNGFLGFAFQYDRADIGRSASTADADRFHVGTVYKHVNGNLFGSMSLVATYAQTDALRHYSDAFDPTANYTATSKRESLALASRLRAGYRFSKGAFDLTPMLDLDLALHRQFAYHETGAGGFGSHVSASTNFLKDLHPRVQLGTHFDAGSANVRLYGEIGQRFALNDPSVDFGLAGGLAGDATVSMVQERESSQNSWGVGMIADLDERLEMRLTYDVTDGDMEKNERLNFKLAYKF